MFQLSIYELPKSKVVRNVDGTRNSQGSITHAVNLEVQYNDQSVPLLFMVMNMGSKTMLLGMPFLAAFNPDMNWKNGTFLGDVIASTKDAHNGYQIYKKNSYQN